MAEHLASIFATEKDRVNCPFYFKIGACRHGDRCSRLHTKPSTSPTLLLSNIYQRPDMLVGPGPGPTPSSDDPDKPDPHFDNFYEDLFLEMAKYGTVLALNVCDNLADHMVGNVYVQYKEEEHAANALRSLTGRFYSGHPIIVDYSPVTDFREATCRQYEENTCNRGGYCNFMHLKRISRELRRELFGKHKGRNSSRSRSPVRHEEHSHGGRGGSGRRYNDRRHNNEGRGWRRRSISPPSHRRGRSRSPGRKRNRSPVREGSEERRARIEQWNKEREQQQQGIATKVNGANIGHADLQSPPDKHQDY